MHTQNMHESLSEIFAQLSLVFQVIMKSRDYHQFKKGFDFLEIFETQIEQGQAQSLEMFNKILNIACTRYLHTEFESEKYEESTNDEYLNVFLVS